MVTCAFDSEVREQFHNPADSVTAIGSKSGTGNHTRLSSEAPKGVEVRILNPPKSSGIIVQGSVVEDSKGKDERCLKISQHPVSTRNGGVCAIVGLARPQGESCCTEARTWMVSHD